MSISIFLIRGTESLSRLQIPASVAAFATSKLGLESPSLAFQGTEGTFLFEICGKDHGPKEWERLRKAGASIASKLNEWKEKEALVQNVDAVAEEALALAEGIALANYKFTKYLKDANKKAPTLKNIQFNGEGESLWPLIQARVSANHIARNLVNEPVVTLNATALGEAFTELGKEAGFTVEVWNKSKIEAQKMGGLLAVNKGSQDPPTFSILEYKPDNAINGRPLILVGKGVVFDTGGLSLKPTPQSMDYMKCDMAGSAVVGGVLYGAAKAQLPYWIIGLVPATDNRPGENAICPGDIITMYDGTTVEVLNTDAEGRLILADALSFAKKYEPELVLDFATLTGAAARALGSYGSAMMGTASAEIKNQIKSAGENVYERLAELPLWEEYYDEMKGDISDLKNLGKAEGGAQTAAMFLRHFIDYPWLHFDIAGTAFNHANDGYRLKGGTGVGVRMVLEFIAGRVHGN